MDKRTRQYNLDLDFRIRIGALRINVLCINFEAPVPEWGYGLHSHSSYELHFIPRGKGELRVNRKRYAITPGTLYLTGPGIFHEQKAERLDPMSEFCINFELLPDRPETRYLPAMLLHERQTMLAILEANSFWFGQDRFDSIPLFEEIFDEIENSRLGSYARIENLLALAIINALRNFSPALDSPADLPRKGLHEARRFLIDRYFDQAEAPAREELAALVGTSIRQLNRILADYYGLSFVDKLNHSRLEKASVLLVSSRTSILEISEELGFSSQGYFSQRFRERFGISPAQFRKKHRTFPFLGHQN